jgi:glutamyl-tRNA synthetase
LKIIFPQSLRTRIAPTPSGFLHIGNAFSFVLTWKLVRMNHGTLILRIDDLDNARFRPEYLKDIFETLSWLGIECDEGAKNVDDFEKNYTQKLRLAHYFHLLEKLKQKNVLFACQCSRKQLQESNSTLDICRQKEFSFEEKELSWKLKTELLPYTQIIDLLKGKQENFVHECMPDFVVRRKDEIPAYQLVSLVDDVLFRVNFIVRGQDLWYSSFAQKYIADILEISDFQNITFLHHPLFLDNNGQKLSKSQGASDLRAWRSQKRSPQIIYEMVEEFYKRNFDSVI